MLVLGGPRFVVAAEPSCRADGADSRPTFASSRLVLNPLDPPFLGDSYWIGGHPQTLGKRASPLCTPRILSLRGAAGDAAISVAGDCFAFSSLGSVNGSQ